MNLTHEISVPARLDPTWAAFNHVELLASCFPGATLTRVDEHDFAGALKVKLGSWTLTYAGTGELEERHLGGRHTVLTLNGTERRGRGTAKAKLTTRFAEAGDVTVVRTSTELSFTGPPAQLAPGVVEVTADRLVAQFAAALSARFAAGLGAEVLAADADPHGTRDLGQPDGAGSTYTYHPPAPSSQTDYDVLVRTAPVWAKRAAAPMLAGLAALWLVRRIRRR